MKRKLDSKYEDLVKYVNAQKDGVELMDILKRFYEKTSDCTSEEYSFITTICSGFRWAATRDSLVPIITDIYNDNYELEEPECYWKLNINGERPQNYYAYKYHYVASRIGIDPDKNMADKFTETELNNLLSHTQTNLTINNFTPVEKRVRVKK
jgi:hypothetical protein